MNKDIINYLQKSREYLKVATELFVKENKSFDNKELIKINKMFDKMITKIHSDYIKEMFKEVRK